MKPPGAKRTPPFFAIWAFVGAAILLGGQPFRSHGTPPGWTTDLGAALAQAKKERKNVLVDFNATWCGPCQEYKEKVFPGPEFKKSTADMILVDLDVDKDQAAAAAHKIGPIPHIKILDPDGRTVAEVIGYDPIGLAGALATAKGK
ncbi:MAG: thioredoxin family protein [Armatimonadetes bacterium]|nr:thioredoxin family protein [Armatimonadota bacterium]